MVVLRDFFLDAALFLGAVVFVVVFLGEVCLEALLAEVTFVGTVFFFVTFGFMVFFSLVSAETGNEKTVATSIPKTTAPVSECVLNDMTC